MQTKKILLSLMVLSSLEIMTTGNEINSDGSSVANVQQEVASVLIKQVFSVLKPMDQSFISALASFDTFTKEKNINPVLMTAAKFFPDSHAYYEALGNYMESQKFPFLAGLFYYHAHKYIQAKGDDVSCRLKSLGVTAVVGILDKLTVSSQFVQNQRELFTKKDANGKSPLDQANDVYKLVAAGFKDRVDFVKAIYDHQLSVGGNVNVVQMFGDSFVTAK